MSDEINNKENKSEEKAPDLSRRAAIEKGMEELDKGENKETETKEEKPKETKDEEHEETDETETSEEETKNALTLFRALNDPSQGPQLLRILAREAGLTQDSSKEEKKEITKTIKETVQEGLGDEYKFLADRLGDTLEKIINSEVDKKTKDIRERQDAGDREKLGNEIDVALTSCFDQYESVPKEVKVRFDELIDEMPPVPGKTKPRTYFDRLIKIAFDEVKVVPKLKSLSKEETKIENKSEMSQLMKDRLKRNKSDATSRLASKGAAAEVDETSKNAPQPKSRREAVELAAKQAEALMKQ